MRTSLRSCRKSIALIRLPRSAAPSGGGPDRKGAGRSPRPRCAPASSMELAFGLHCAPQFRRRARSAVGPAPCAKQPGGHDHAQRTLDAFRYGAQYRVGRLWCRVPARDGLGHFRRTEPVSRGERGGSGKASQGGLEHSLASPSSTGSRNPHPSRTRDSTRTDFTRDPHLDSPLTVPLPGPFSWQAFHRLTLRKPRAYSAPLARMPKPAPGRNPSRGCSSVG